MKKFYFVLLVIAFFAIQASGQKSTRPTVVTENLVGRSYSLNLQPIEIEGFEGLHSFAAGQRTGLWVLIGGRTDGLHRMRPFEAFLARDNNIEILVLDPVAKKCWKAGLGSLPVELREQLQSTNMLFHQDGNRLLLVGGYGYSGRARDHVTHDKLTLVDIDGLISAIQAGRPITSFFRQISDPMFALTGGQMGMIDDTVFLVGGQRFDGRYNPMGPDHGPGFFQEYSNQIRKFRILDDGKKFSIEKLAPITDSVNLHRRDFNMLPQVFQNGKPGFTVFSGVFQVDADVPYTNTVDILNSSTRAVEGFTQYLNHYHSAKAALYDGRTRSTENIFFGGISQYEENAGALVRNDDVPFTKVIGKVTRDKHGKLSESKIAEMPGYLGASAEFLANPKLPAYENGILKIDKFSGKQILLGHIVGGIESTGKSIFFRNRGSQSIASSKVFEVWLRKKTGKK